MQAPTDYNEQGPRKKPNYNWVWIVVAVVAICGCGGAGILGAILVPVFMQARNAATKTACLSNVKQLAMGQIMYSTDYDDRLPAAGTWNDTLPNYVRNDRTFDCPMVRKKGERGGYAMNSSLSGKKLASYPSPQSIVSIYESANLKANAAGDPKSEGPTNRHGPGRNEGYLDGHGKWIKTGDSTSGMP